MGYFSCHRESAVFAANSQPTTTSRKRKLRLFSREELESATSGFSPSAFLGRGSHGSVFLAALDGGRLLAAAKVPSPPPIDDSTTTTTDSEIDILSCLPCLGPHLVNLLGRTLTTPHIAVVELMLGGSLHDLLHSPKPPPPLPRRVRLALQAAKAVAFLHSLDPPVIHRDIKPSNVLIDGAGRARLGDFGLAIRLPPASSSAAPASGTMGYIDPGYVAPADVSTKCDVYSFGVLLLEIMSGRRAIDFDYSPPYLVEWAAPLIAAERYEELWTRDGPVVDREAAEDLALLAGWCVVPAAEARPCMAELVGRLRSVNRRVRSPPPMTWRRLAGWVRGGNPSSNRDVSDVAA